MKKYELILNDSIELANCKLFRVRALINFADVKVGDLGGYIQREENLSHHGNAWVADNAKVWGEAEVSENAKVWGEAEVTYKAKVFGEAEVSENAKVYGSAQVAGSSKVSGHALVSGNVLVWGEVEVSGTAEVSGNTELYGDAKVTKLEDIIVFKNHWSSGDTITYTKSNKMWKVFHFYGTGQELIDKGYRESKNSGDHYKVYVEFVETLEQLDKELHL